MLAPRTHPGVPRRALTTARITAALARQRQLDIAARSQILDGLRSDQLDLSASLTAAYGAAVRSLIAVLATLNGSGKPACKRR